MKQTENQLSDISIERAGQIPRDDLASHALQETISYLDRPLALTQLDKEKNTANRLSPDDKTLTDIHEGLLRMAAEIKNMPSHDEGINLERVDIFRRSMGIAKKPILILSSEDFKHASELGAGSSSETTVSGEYLPVPDVIIMKDDPEQQALNGPELLESLIVHEIAHSHQSFHEMQATIGRRKRLFRRDFMDVAVQTARFGFVVNDSHEATHGDFLEEAYAEYVRGQYVVNILGRDNGFVEPTGEVFDPLNKYRLKVAKPDGSIGVAMPLGALPALLLETLFKRTPELIDKFEQARHSAEGLKNLIKSLDGIDPGLYKRLRDIDIHSEAFTRQTINVISSLADNGHVGIK
ncbi:MAG: hypothetical protein ACOH18_04245 [Candidatus Saccharimonadaceae bacterium]